MYGLEAEYWGRIDFLYLDRADRATRWVQERYRIIFQPMFVFIEPDGTEVKHWFLIDADEARAVFDAYLASH